MGKHQRLRWNLAHLMNNAYIRGFLVICIAANAVTIGLEADYGDGSGPWFVIEVIFLCIFTLELIANLVAWGFLFWDDAWNWLDFVVIIICLIDFGIAMSSGGEGSAISIFRLLRILRVIRVVSFLDTLVYLVAAFVQGMQSVSWVLFLWVLALYIFAVLGKGLFGDDSHLKNEVNIDIDQHFGSVPQTMLTLISFCVFDSAMGIMRPIMEVYPWSCLYFMSFVTFISIGVMELIAAIFIDSLFEAKKKREEMETKEQEKRRHKVQQLIRGLFDAFDNDGDGHLDKQELDECLAVFDDPETREVLEHVQLNPEMLKRAIAVADLDGNGSVTADEFSLALESVHVQPNVSDLRQIHQRMGQVLREIVEKVDSNQIDTNERLKRIEALLTASSPKSLPPPLPLASLSSGSKEP